MNTPSKLAVPLLAGALLLALVPSMNATVTFAPLNEDHPSYRPVDIEDTILLNPTNWVQYQGQSGLFDDEPVWVALRSATPNTNYRVSVSASGGAIAGMDVYKLVHQSDSPDQVTPACPQGLLTDYLYPGSGEPAGAYLQRLIRLTTAEHQTAIPGLLDTVAVTLDADEDYMVVVDGRLGTGGAGLSGSEVTYDIRLTTSGIFDFSYPPIANGDRTPLLRLGTWSDNQDECIEQGPVLPPGVPEQPPAPPGVPEPPELPEVPEVPLPDLPDLPAGSTTLPGLGLDMSELFGASL